MVEKHIMNNFDIDYRILLESHPYHTSGLCSSNTQYQSICNDKLFLARLANKWCWSNRSVEEILEDLPNLTYAQVTEVSLFYSPLGRSYDEDGVVIINGSVGKFNPVSLYYQACLRGYSEAKCMLFIDEILTHPIDIDVEFSIARIVPIHMIAVKYNHKQVLEKLRNSLILRGKDVYEVRDTNIGDKLYNSYTYLQVISFTLCALTECWLGIGEESQSSLDYLQDIVLEDHEVEDVRSDIENTYMKYMRDVGIGLDLKIIFTFIRESIRRYNGQDNFSENVIGRDIEYNEENPYVILGYMLSNLLSDQDIKAEMEESVVFQNPKVTLEDPKLASYLHLGIFSHLWDNDMKIDTYLKLIYRRDLLDNELLPYTKETFIRVDDYYDLLRGTEGNEALMFNRFGLVGYNPESLKVALRHDYHPDH